MVHRWPPTTLSPQFAIECLRRSNQQGVGHFGPKFLGVLLGVDPWCLGVESEHPNGEIISEEFQPIWSQSTNVTDGLAGGRTNDICDRKTALCTIVHRAVKVKLCCRYVQTLSFSRHWRIFLKKACFLQPTLVWCPLAEERPAISTKSIPLESTLF